MLTQGVHQSVEPECVPFGLDVITGAVMALAQSSEFGIWHAPGMEDQLHDAISQQVALLLHIGLDKLYPDDL